MPEVELHWIVEKKVGREDSPAPNVAELPCTLDTVHFTIKGLEAVAAGSLDCSVCW